MSNVKRHGMNIKEAYHLLELKEGASLELIKQSYRRAAKLYHPDAHTGLSDTEKFHKIVSAYNLIVEDYKKRGPRAGDGGFAANGAGWKRFTDKTSARIMDFMRVRRQPVDHHDNFSKDKKVSALRTYEELAARYDESHSVWIQIEVVHTMYSRYRGKFEHFAIPRLPKAQEKALVEFIRVLGKIRTMSALNAISPYLMSRNKEVCCAAFIALDSAGDKGQAVIDRALNTPSAVMYQITGLFGRTDEEKMALRGRLVSKDKMRRLSMLVRKTGLPLSDLLEGIGVPLSGAV